MFRGIRGPLQPLCVGAVLTALAVAGCAGEDGDSTAKGKTEIAAASESEKVFIERTAKLLETTATKKDCAQLEEINARSFTRFTCPPDKPVRRSMASFEVVDSQDYGTGAVVDYESGEVEDGASIVLFVAPDRNWGIGRFGIITEPSIGTSDEESREGFDRTVDAYLAAIRKRDCKAFLEVAFTGDDKARAVCETTFPATSVLAKRLRSNPSAKPKYQGGNRTYGFYKLETLKPRPESSTISVIRAGVGAAAQYRVLDVAPGPTAAEQRRVEREFRKQRERGDQDSMLPEDGGATGRKAD